MDGEGVYVARASSAFAVPHRGTSWSRRPPTTVRFGERYRLLQVATKTDSSYRLNDLQT